jgi:long-chain acyl-CoA synthetase
VAYVALADGAQLNSVALLRYLKQHLADYKVPRHVIILPSLPRNATGKILKTVLRTLPRPARREVKAA